LKLSSLGPDKIGGFARFETQRIKTNVTRVVVGFEHPKIGRTFFEGPAPPYYAAVQLREGDDAY
jgi:hypothetical protein